MLVEIAKRWVHESSPFNDKAPAGATTVTCLKIIYFIQNEILYLFPGVSVRRRNGFPLKRIRLTLLILITRYTCRWTWFGSAPLKVTCSFTPLYIVVYETWYIVLFYGKYTLFGIIELCDRDIFMPLADRIWTQVSSTQVQHSFFSLSFIHSTNRAKGLTHISQS